MTDSKDDESLIIWFHFMRYVSSVEDLSEGRPTLVPGSYVWATESTVQYTTRAPGSNVVATESTTVTLLMWICRFVGIWQQRGRVRCADAGYVIRST